MFLHSLLLTLEFIISLCCHIKASSNLVGTDDCRNTLISCGVPHDEGLTLLALSNLPLVVGRGSLIIGESGDRFSGLEVEIGGEWGITIDGKIDGCIDWDLASFTVPLYSDCAVFLRPLIFLGFAPVNFPISSSLSFTFSWLSTDWVSSSFLDEDSLAGKCETLIEHQWVKLVARRVFKVNQFLGQILSR